MPYDRTMVITRPDDTRPFFFEVHPEFGTIARSDLANLGVLSIVTISDNGLEFSASHPCDTIEELTKYKEYFTTTPYLNLMIEYCNSVGHTFTWTYDSVETETIWNNISV